MNCDKLIQIISEVTKLSSEEISEDTNLYYDLGMDSLEFFKMISCIEEEVGTELSFISMENVSTVGEVLSMVVSRGSYVADREIYHG